MGLASLGVRLGREPGDYLLTARAATASGDRQPMDGSWNRGGFGNNGAQLVPVTCLD